jgi:uncharacterized 2Fe-2S/4Fe-4S cluster protein (DUF4445 family)
MLHLFANEDPSAMGEIPFTPKFLEARIYKGADLQLSADTVQLMPGISAFVGGDIVSDLAALDILGKKDKCLLVDIGTNGEMALWTGGKLLCTSTAAGPALEGAEISCGMGALPGAIDKIAAGENGALSFTTIGGAPPRGLCGCGLVDAVAAMLKTGALDETGLLADDCEGGFTIYDPARQGAECGCGVGAKAAGKKVSVSGKDVRQYQLAKSAIVSGIRLLCAAAGVGLAELETVFIAGGLGFFINIENAIATGLLPPEFRGKTAVCGNLSLRGAAQCLKSGAEFLARCAEIAAKSETYELASDPHFMEAFAENMLFE